MNLPTITAPHCLTVAQLDPQRPGISASDQRIALDLEFARKRAERDSRRSLFDVTLGSMTPWDVAALQFAQTAAWNQVLAAWGWSLLADMPPTVRRVYQALQKLPSVILTLYRGVAFASETELDDFLTHYAPGRDLTLDSFASYDRSLTTGLEFASHTLNADTGHWVKQRQGILFQFDGESARDLSLFLTSGMAHGGAREAVLLPGTKLHVDRVDRAPGLTTVKLRDNQSLF